MVADARRPARVCGALLAVLLAAASCSARGPARPIPVVVESSLPAESVLQRRFGLADARWYDEGVYRQLRDGRAESDPDPADPSQSYEFRIDGDPVFTDLDGDGDADAAAETFSASGGVNSYSTRVYLWLWNGRRAEQIHLPVFYGGRCGDQIASLRPDPGGLRVDALLKTPETSCAEGGTVPVSWVVSVRQGFPLRLRPRLSAAVWCNPADFDVNVPPGYHPIARAAPDAGAPPLPVGDRYESVRLSRRTEADPRGVTWHLALLTSPDGATDCGWVSGR
jgi:hypothetical protein